MNSAGTKAESQTKAAHSRGTKPRVPWSPARPARGELAIGAGGAIAGHTARLMAGRQLRQQFDIFLAPPRAASTDKPGDPGLFGPDSVMWEVMGDPSLFIAGSAAVTMQGLHPRAFAGFADHTDFNNDPNGRLIRTAQYLLTTAFGDTASAKKAINYAVGAHRNIKGSLPDGRTYDANEPELAMWVHLTIYAATAAAFQRFGPRRLSDAELDQFVAESAIVGRLFGLADSPTTWSGLEQAIEDYRPLLSINVRAARGLSYFREPFGLDAVTQRLYKAIWPGAMACMPPMCRNLLMQPEPSALELAGCRALVRGIESAIGEPPLKTAARARLEAVAS